MKIGMIGKPHNERNGGEKSRSHGSRNVSMSKKKFIYVTEVSFREFRFDVAQPLPHHPKQSLRAALLTETGGAATGLFGLKRATSQHSPWLVGLDRCRNRATIEIVNSRRIALYYG